MFRLKNKNAKFPELYPNVEYSTLELTMLPNEYTTLTDAEDLELWNRLLTLLDDVDDVQDLFHNIVGLDDEEE